MTSNRSRRGWFLASGLGIVVVALLAVLCLTGFNGRRAGPSYAGKTLRQWIDAMDSPNPSVRTQAIASVRSIGTNALPALIDWMAQRDDSYRRDFYQFLRSKRAMVWMWPTLMENSEPRSEYRALLGVLCARSGSAACSSGLGASRAHGEFHQPGQAYKCCPRLCSRRSC